MPPCSRGFQRVPAKAAVGRHQMGRCQPGIPEDPHCPTNVAQGHPEPSRRMPPILRSNISSPKHAPGLRDLQAGDGLSVLLEGSRSPRATPPRGRKVPPYSSRSPPTFRPMRWRTCGRVRGQGRRRANHLQTRRSVGKDLKSAKAKGGPVAL